MAEKEPLVGEEKGDNDADVHVTVEDGESAQRAASRGGRHE